MNTKNATKNHNHWLYDIVYCQWSVETDGLSVCLCHQCHQILMASVNSVKTAVLVAVLCHVCEIKASSEQTASAAWHIDTAELTDSKTERVTLLSRVSVSAAAGIGWLIDRLCLITHRYYLLSIKKQRTSSLKTKTRGFPYISIPRNVSKKSFAPWLITSNIWYKNLAIANRSRVSCINTNYTMTLTSDLEVTQGHWKWYYLKAWVRFPIRLL